MDDCVLVFSTCPNLEEATRIAEILVEERLAACVNIVPGITSIYRWEDAVTQDTELLLLIKTTTSRFEQLSARITQLHSYDTPEIVAMPIISGSQKYLRWLATQTSSGL